jgi:hypothetical protein
VFRDSRGVVHTVSSVDPLADLPLEAQAALQGALLQGGDLGTQLEQCEAVRDLLDDWQTAFFESLPDEVDLEEEARVAAEAGLSLAEVEADGVGDDLLLPDPATGQEELDLELHAALVADDADDPRHRLPEELVAILERSLLLLPYRVRLEALIAAADLVEEWEQLLADHEKLLGHVVLSHSEPALRRGHEELLELHAHLHDDMGPGH